MRPLRDHLTALRLRRLLSLRQDAPGSVGGFVPARPPTSQQLLRRNRCVSRLVQVALHPTIRRPASLLEIDAEDACTGNERASWRREAWRKRKQSALRCSKINHLAGQGRNRDCLHNAAPRLQYLREHHGSDFIRLAASGQGEDTKPRRVDRINQAGILVCLLRVLTFSCACISCWRSIRS